jgi:hypothetical protein
MDLETDKEQLTRLMVTMEIPDNNRDLSVARNIFWLNRNLAIRNSGHPDFAAAWILLRRVARGVK